MRSNGREATSSRAVRGCCSRRVGRGCHRSTIARRRRARSSFVSTASARGWVLVNRWTGCHGPARGNVTPMHGLAWTGGRVAMDRRSGTSDRCTGWHGPVGGLLWTRARESRSERGSAWTDARVAMDRCPGGRSGAPVGIDRCMGCHEPVRGRLSPTHGNMWIIPADSLDRSQNGPMTTVPPLSDPRDTDRTWLHHNQAPSPPSSGRIAATGGAAARPPRDQG